MAKRDASAPKPLRIALVGGETLLGRELHEVLDSRARIVDYAATGEGNFGEQGGEAVYLEPLRPEAVAEDHAVVVAGSEEGASKAYQLVKAAGGQPLIVDCTGLLEGQPEARIIAPLLNQALADYGWLLVIAHPAATALGLILMRLASISGVRRSVAQIFEPASERGQRGISELHKQTTNLLAFKALDKTVFDAQLSFNLLARYGEDAPTKLGSIEQRIERDLATILGNDQNETLIPMPSLRLIQAPVFHGYSISLWVEFEMNIAIDEISRALASPHIDIRGEEDEVPTNVGVASQSGVIAGDIRIDHNNGRAAWIWIVADNLRLIADAAGDVLSNVRTPAQ